MKLSIPKGFRYPLFYFRVGRFDLSYVLLTALGPLYQTWFVHPDSVWDLGFDSTLDTPTIYSRAWHFGYSIGLARGWFKFWLKGES